MNTLKSIRTAANLAVFKNYPSSLVHFVTERCNARCPHCFIDFDSQTKEMSLDHIRIVARSVASTLANINITGGEPFLRTDLTQIACCYLNEASVSSIYINSNGSMPDRVGSFLSETQSSRRGRNVVLSFSIDHFKEEHDANRGIDGLFDKALASYQLACSDKNGAIGNIGICVSQWNYQQVLDVYKHLRDNHGVRSFTATLVRDEGAFKLDPNIQNDVFSSYCKLTDAIQKDMSSGRTDGYDKSSLAGRLLNKKNTIAYEGIRRTVTEDCFLLPCRAASVFGVIRSDGEVHPCEILNSPLGHLRDFDWDLLRLWRGAQARDVARRIQATKCHCTYECAWTFNILCDLRSQIRMLPALLPGS